MALVVIGLLLIDYQLFAFFAPINSQAHLERLSGQGLPALATSGDDSAPVRYHEMLTSAAGEFSPLAFAGHEMATGYDPLVNQRYKEFSGIDEAGRSNLLTMLSDRDRTLDLLNVAFVIIPRNIDRDSWTSQVAFSNRWLERETTPAGARVFENRTSLPRAWLCPRVLIATEDDQLLLIRGKAPDDFDPRTVALLAPRSLEKGVNPSLLSPSQRDAISTSRVRITHRTPVEMTLDVDPPQRTVLVLSELSSQGWKATIDAQEAPLMQVDYILRGLELEPGRHEVRLFYKPASLAIGATLSLAGIVGVLVMLRKGSEKGSERAAACRCLVKAS